MYTPIVYPSTSFVSIVHVLLTLVLQVQHRQRRYTSRFSLHAPRTSYTNSATNARLELYRYVRLQEELRVMAEGMTNNHHTSYFDCDLLRTRSLFTYIVRHQHSSNSHIRYVVLLHDRVVTTTALGLQRPRILSASEEQLQQQHYQQHQLTLLCHHPQYNPHYHDIHDIYNHSNNNHNNSTNHNITDSIDALISTPYDRRIDDKRKD